MIFPVSRSYIFSDFHDQKQRFTGILQKSSSEEFTEKNLCKSLFLNKVADLRPGILFGKRLLQRCFPVSFTKYTRAPFLQITSG